VAGRLLRRLRVRDGIPSHQRGAVAVEFALVLPLFVTLVLGVFTMGLAYSDQLSISNAVREGSRLGAATDHSADWATSVRDRVKQVYFNSASTLTDDQICVRLVDSGDGNVATAALGSDCGTEPPTPVGMDADSCLVKVWVRKPARILFGVVPDAEITLAANSVSYYGRTVEPCTA
jgi:Flp pilus assembly protein TadG